MNTGTIANLGIALADLVMDQSEWSQKMFGTDQERGPMGPVRHLVKESQEVEAALDVYNAGQCSKDAVTEELADCLILVLDASRRHGVKVMQLIEAAQAKMQKNKARAWPKPVDDMPVEHVRTNKES